MTEPQEFKFVLDVPATDDVVVERHEGFDTYRPAGVDGPLPAVVFVPGPIPADAPFRPRDGLLFPNYSRLVVARGFMAVVADLPYYDFTDLPANADRLAEIVDGIQTSEAVDDLAIWAFSGGGMLVRRWLSESPAWLRGLALTYPALSIAPDDVPPVPPPGTPVVLTRVGLEHEFWLAVVDDFLARSAEAGTEIQVIDVPDGHHGFDVRDHTEQAREAVVAAVDAVAKLLGQRGHFGPQ